MEEIGEASKELLEFDFIKYQKEIIQVAAVSVAMLEHLYRRKVIS